MSEFNEEDARHFYRWLGHKEGEFTEIRAIIWPPGNVAQYWVANEEEFIKTCKKWSGKRQVYAGVNPRKRKGGSAEDVARVTIIPFDVDSPHEKDQPATSEELEKSKTRMIAIVSWIRTQGYKMPLVVMSGNGHHILEKVDLAIEKNLTGKLEAYFHEAPTEGLDSIFDLPRIIKVAGTKSVKGTHSETKPHRLSFIVNEGDPEIDDTLGQHIKELTPYVPEIFVQEKIGSTEKGSYYLNTKIKKLRPCFRYFVENGGRLSPKRKSDHLLRLALVQEGHVNKFGRNEIIDLFRGAIDFKEAVTTKAVDYQLKDILKKGPKPWTCVKIRLHEGCLGGICPLYMKKERRSAATRLVEYCLEATEDQIILFHDQHKEPYIRIQQKTDENSTPIMSTIPLRTRNFSTWLSALMWGIENKVPSGSAIKDAINVLTNKALEGDQHILYNRVAPAKNGIWIDIADSRNRAIKITKEKWEIIDDPPILFKRYSHQLPFAVDRDAWDARDAYFPIVNVDESASPGSLSPPFIQLSHDLSSNNMYNKETSVSSVPSVPFEDAWKLIDYVNLAESDELIFMVDTITKLIPGIPHSILFIYGFQGSGKSLLMKMIKSIVDPSSVPLLSIPKNEAEAVQQLSHNWCVFYDNVSYISHWMSDVFCRAATGASFTKRALWTDDEDVLYDILRCIGLNGINIAANRPDLLDRTLLIRTRDILPSERKEERVLWYNFQMARSTIVRGILGVLSKALEVYPTIHLDKYFRMADYMKWGCAVAVALGRTQEEYLGVYERKVREQIEEAVNSSSVGAVVMDYMETRADIWEGSPTLLYSTLTERAKEIGISTRAKEWPKAPHILTKRLNELTPNLRVLGVEVTTGKKSGSRRKVSMINVGKIDGGEKPVKGGLGGFFGRNGGDEEEEEIVTGEEPEEDVPGDPPEKPPTIKTPPQDSDSSGVKMALFALGYLEREGNSVGRISFQQVMTKEGYHANDVGAVLGMDPRFSFDEDIVSLVKPVEEN